MQWYGTVQEYEINCGSLFTVYIATTAALCSQLWSTTAALCSQIWSTTAALCSQIWSTTAALCSQLWSTTAALCSQLWSTTVTAALCSQIWSTTAALCSQIWSPCCNLCIYILLFSVWLSSSLCNCERVSRRLLPHRRHEWCQGKPSGACHILFRCAGHSWHSPYVNNSLLVVHIMCDCR